MFNIGVVQLVSGFLSEVIVSYVAVGLVCLWEEVSSGVSNVTFLNLKIPMVIYLFSTLRKVGKKILIIQISFKCISCL